MLGGVWRSCKLHRLSVSTSASRLDNGSCDASGERLLLDYVLQSRSSHSAQRIALKEMAYRQGGEELETGLGGCRLLLLRRLQRRGEVPLSGAWLSDEVLDRSRPEMQMMEGSSRPETWHCYV